MTLRPNIVKPYTAQTQRRFAIIGPKCYCTDCINKEWPSLVSDRMWVKATTAAENKYGRDVYNSVLQATISKPDAKIRSNVFFSRADKDAIELELFALESSGIIFSVLEDGQHLLCENCDDLLED